MVWRSLLSKAYAIYALFSILVLGGFTRLNFSACSGVVSGQSVSKMIGFSLASSSDFFSLSEKESAAIISFDISLAFTII